MWALSFLGGKSSPNPGLRLPVPPSANGDRERAQGRERAQALGPVSSVRLRAAITPRPPQQSRGQGGWAGMGGPTHWGTSSLGLPGPCRVWKEFPEPVRACSDLRRWLELTPQTRSQRGGRWRQAGSLTGLCQPSLGASRDSMRAPPSCWGREGESRVPSNGWGHPGCCDGTCGASGHGHL